MPVPELVDYIRKALQRQYPAIVIRTALKKSGHADKDISAAFAQLRSERPQQPKILPKATAIASRPTPKTVPPTTLPDFSEFERPAPDEQVLLAQEDVVPSPPEEHLPLPPKISDVQVLSEEERKKRHVHVRHIIAACLFLLALILLMYAALAPLLLRVG